MQNNSLKNSLLLFILAGIVTACSPGISEETFRGKLPILGEKEIVTDSTNQVDTIYHTIPPFQFWDQDSNVVDNATFENKIYIADFFFTSCPSICITMGIQMHRMYENLRNVDDVVLLSHSIDPERDSVARLKQYAAKMGSIDADRWHFVTGDKDHIYDMAKAYFENAAADPEAPGGYIHSGYFYLVDKQKRIRGLYLGTDEKQVDQLLKDIGILRNE